MVSTKGTQSTFTMEAPDSACVLRTHNANNHHIAATQHRDTTTNFLSRRFVAYHSISTQTLPPSNGNEFKEIHGRDPVGREFEYGMGLAALGRYGHETGANTHELGYNVTISAAKKDTLFTDAGFQTMPFHERKIALVRAKVQATMMANKYRNVAKEAGYCVWTEMNEEKIVHSEQFIFKVQFDSNGNAIDQDVNGRAFPNIYGEEIGSPSTSMDLTPPKFRQQLGSTFVSPARSQERQGHVSLAQSHVPLDSSTSLTLRHSAFKETTQKSNSKQSFLRHSSPSPGPIQGDHEPINTNKAGFVIVDDTEEHDLKSPKTLDSISRSSKNHKTTEPGDFQLKARSSKRSRRLKARGAVQRLTNSTSFDQSTNTALTSPSRSIAPKMNSDRRKDLSSLRWIRQNRPSAGNSRQITAKLSNGPDSAIDHAVPQLGRRRVEDTDYNKKSDQGERSILPRRSPTPTARKHHNLSRSQTARGDDGIENTTTSSRGLKDNGNGSHSPSRCEMIPESMQPRYRRESTVPESLVTDHQSCQTKIYALMPSRNGRVGDYDQRTNHARTPGEDQRYHNIADGGAGYDGVRKNKLNHQLTNTRHISEHDSYRMKLNANTNNIARTRNELERRRELRYRALSGGNTQQHAQESCFDATESSQQRAKEKAAQKVDPQLVGERSVKHSSVLHARELEIFQPENYSVRTDTINKSSLRSSQVCSRKKDKAHETKPRSDASSTQGSPRNASKRPYGKIDREERAQVSMYVTKKIAEPHVRRAHREEIVRYVPRILRQIAQKSAQENDGGDWNELSTEQKGGDQNGYEDRRKRQKRSSW